MFSIFLPPGSQRSAGCTGCWPAMAPMCRWICTYSCTNWERKSAPVPGCSAVQCSVVAEPLHVSRSLAHDLALVIHELATNAWQKGVVGIDRKSVGQGQSVTVRVDFGWS